VQLSDACLDLLDKIFVIKAEQRITLDKIKVHPWFTKPLPGKYAAAERAIEAEQAVLDEHTKGRTINAVGPLTVFRPYIQGCGI
jgi:hypothetical protein